jgi:LmbE family N-acetylglucosaminyl deacetylase
MKVKDIFLVAHPDDAEVMLGNAVAASEEPLVVVATDGTNSTIDMVGSLFCPVRA